ncbi:YlbL family protein [Micrococcus porci]|uniref:YlbL family protein n=1 Tax=Micrococcus porci TaxID=2856555 RepID=UPI003CF9B95D
MRAAPPRPRGGSRRRPGRTPVSGRLALGSAALALVLPVPYILEGPGPAIDVLGEQDGTPVLTVEGGTADPGEGRLDMTTVLVSGPPGGTTGLGDLVTALTDGTVDAQPRELVHPSGVSADTVAQSNAAAMTDSQDVATAAALRALGRDVPAHLAVHATVPGAPAEGILRVGDVILAAAGRSVTDMAGIRAAVDAAGPGDLALTLRRDGAERQVSVPVTAADPATGRSWQLGVLLEQRFDLPVQAEFALEDIGGPSAGMMFALAVIERLTPGDMTGGARIAGTGTITADGVVGPIGGIPQKVQGAARDGADVFLAPRENCADLAGRVPAGMTVYAVDTLATARAVVEAVGRGERPDDVPTCS